MLSTDSFLKLVRWSVNRGCLLQSICNKLSPNGEYDFLHWLKKGIDLNLLEKTQAGLFITDIPLLIKKMTGLDYEVSSKPYDHFDIDTDTEFGIYRTMSTGGEKHYTCVDWDNDNDCCKRRADFHIINKMTFRKLSK